jgi:cytochrome c oxidase assembly protein subunit 15
MNQGLHRFTLLVTFATLLLIVAGALVTSHDAGLATSDWPLSNGQVFPPMVGNLFWEHGHRLIAATIGALTFVLAIWYWKSETRRGVRRLGIAAFGIVLAQGLLGGLTVKLMLPLVVSAAHACLAQLFFCTMVSLSVFTSSGWMKRDETRFEEGEGVSLRHLGVAAGVAVFVQLIIGATLRHSATWDQQLPTSLLLTHIAGACVVTLVLGSVILTTLNRYAREAYLARPAKIIAGLLTVQLLLGLAAYMARRVSPNDPQPLNPMVGITVAHVACGALVLALTVVLTLRAYRLLSPAESAIEISRAPHSATT